MKRTANCAWRCYILAGIIALILGYLLNGYLNRDIFVPISSEGDTTSTYKIVGNFARGHWIYKYPEIGAPFGVDNSDQMMFFTLHALILKVLTICTNGKVGLTINLFYLLTFFLISVFTCYALRQLEVSDGSSIVGGVLYSLLPYHFFRNVCHIWLAAYYFIPLVSLSLIWLMKGELIGGLKKNFKLKISIVFVFLLGMSDLYYSAFYLLLWAFCFAYMILLHKRMKGFMNLFLLPFSNVLAIFIQLIPTIYTNFSNIGNNVVFINRNSSDIEGMSLRMSMMFLPIHGHRLHLFAKIRSYFEEVFSLTTLNSSVSLGVFMCIGLIILILPVLFDKVNFQGSKYFKVASKITLMCLIIATFGGICDFVGMLIPYIRAYNRFVVFIAFFSIFSFGLLLDRIRRYLYNSKFFKKNTAQSILLILVLIIGVLDQTSMDYAKYSDYSPFNFRYSKTAEKLNEQGKNLQKFVEKIEQSLEKYPMVFQLPINADNMWNTFPNGVIGGYDLVIPSSFAKKTSWSFGGGYRDSSDQWLNKIKNLTTKKLLLVMAHVEFGGIYIDPRGYSEEDLKSVRKVIESVTGASAFYEKSNDLYFYNIENYIDKLKTDYSESDWKKIKDYLLYDFPGYYIGKYNAADLNYLKNLKFDKKGNVVLKEDNIQYGPYVRLPAGLYKISIKGEKMQNAIVECSADSGEKRISIKILKKADDEIVYCIKVKEDVENVEFLTRSNGLGEAIIKSLSYESIYDEPVDYIMEYPSSELSFNKNQKFDEEGNAILSKGDMQFGPYTWLSAGKYEVVISGKGMKNAEVSCTADVGKQSIPVKITKVTDTQIVYRIELEKDVENVEFLTRNNKSGNIKIKNLKYCIISQK